MHNRQRNGIALSHQNHHCCRRLGVAATSFHTPHYCRSTDLKHKKWADTWVLYHAHLFVRHVAIQHVVSATSFNTTTWHSQVFKPTTQLFNWHAKDFQQIFRMGCESFRPTHPASKWHTKGIQKPRCERTGPTHSQVSAVVEFSQYVVQPYIFVRNSSQTTNMVESVPEQNKLFIKTKMLVWSWR